MGRPTKLTPELQAAIVARIAEGNYGEVAARACGVSRTAFYAWMKRGRAGELPFADFHTAVKQAEAEAEAKRVGIITAAAAETWQAAAWYLERKYPERWSTDRKKKRAETRLIEARRHAVVDYDEVLSRATPEELAAIEAVVARVRARGTGSGA